MNKTADTFIALLRSVVTGASEKTDLADVNFEALFALSKFHDLAHIVYYELERRNALPEGDVLTKFKQQYDMAILRHVRRMMTITQIREILEKARIPFILLKGAVLMDLYPEPWMRTSSDVDVLVHEEDLAKAEELFVNAGMERKHEGQYDVSLFSQTNYHIELHYTMLEGFISDQHREVLKNVWLCSACKQNGMAEHVMNGEMFYFYHIAHMAKHFRNGGNGVRTILDTWLLHHRIDFDAARRNALIAEGGLKTFDENAKALSEFWFSHASVCAVNGDFADYIVKGGIYGTFDRYVMVQKKKAGNRFTYYWKRIFPPYNRIKHSYPILKKIPVLLPFYWIIRWFRFLNPAKRKYALQEIKTEKNINADDSAHIESLMRDLEIW